MAKVLISLLGGRLVPNIETILHIRPDYLYFIASEDTLKQPGCLENISNIVPEKLKPFSVESVKPYSIIETRQKCAEIFKKHKSDRIILNTASDPKTMAFGAFAFFMENKDSDIDIVYTSRDGLVWVGKEQENIEPLKISLKTYFESYGWDVSYQMHNVQAEYKNAVKLLAKNIKTSHSLLYAIKEAKNNTKGYIIEINNKLANGEKQLLNSLKNLNLLKFLKETTDSYKLSFEQKNYKFFEGKWLEYYIYSKAANLFTDNDSQKPLFSECGWNVEDRNGKGEIDFVGIFGGQLVLASCKTEKDIKREHLEELHDKASQVGHGICSKIFITTVSAGSFSGKELETRRRWAHERKIVLVMSEDLRYIGKILKKVVLANPKIEPRNVTIFPRG